MIDQARRYRGFAAAAIVLAVLGGCAAGVPEPDRAPPREDRPVVDATLDMAPDLSSATGTQTVRFTPDARICELVFRLWANRPATVEDGTSSRVTRAAVDGTAVTPRTEQAGAPAGAPGTLVELPLPSCVDAGTTVTAELGFDLTLGADSTERIGHSPAAGTAWLGTPLPVLAWVQGRGWARDPAVRMSGETVVSEDARIASLAVTAGADQQVAGVGTPTGTAPAGPGRTTHTFTAEALRDVAVAVGAYRITETTVGATRVHIAVPAAGRAGVGHGGALRGSAQDWADAVAEHLPRLERLLGPYPYPELWLTVVPTQSDGVEFPTHLQFGDVADGTRGSLAAHELAHMWFYSLVGNDQGRDPWLDEAFATWAQALVAGQVGQYRIADFSRGEDGPIGAPMAFWDRRGGGFSDYVTGVYDQGAAALLEGRRRVGEERFDAAMRDYVATHAHRVAAPGDVERAFADLPEVLEVLRAHGAFAGS
ncbi:Peptidase family M1 [Pseudonocardia ammonioxydans]|uniref:Peptidase family M1 n=1 Tax=Pseudonocardia ammonioxydans TaxID=260086 RepID=A0A1I4TWZ7_PSUAM|nr:M1 family aminopeptidase [Pseudonocardia ammonioxydans]SFM81318.1 Peptidase family M1 [Pseudonocardia ammonioxydans]